MYELCRIFKSLSLSFLIFKLMKIINLVGYDPSIERGWGYSSVVLHMLSMF